MVSPKTALVLSAGGMFGAYQAGVWKALSRCLKPDVVAGASVGAVNGWAIAGGVDPGELVERWIDPGFASFAHVRPQAPWRGIFDSRPLHEYVRGLVAACRPKIEIGVVAVEIPALRPRLFRGEEIGWEHLAASCAALLCYAQIRIGGKLYTDGGLLGALPLWAAAEMGASRVVAINALPRMPSRVVRAAVAAIRRLAPRRPAAGTPGEITVISPSEPLGSLRDSLFWSPHAARRWIALGERDAERQLAARF